MPRGPPRPAVPAPKRSPSQAALRQALGRRKKTELVEMLWEGAEADRGVLRQWTAWFEVAASRDERTPVTRQAIVAATRFDTRQINPTFAYDSAAYDEGKRNLSRLIAGGQWHRAMAMALELRKQGSSQVERSEEGLMPEEIEDCLGLVITGVKKSDLPANEIVAWSTSMLAKRNQPPRGR